jgi:hypothetical protein
MRGMWYDYIKPVLSRAGLLNQKTRGGKDVAWDDKLSIYLVELVREGATSYEEMRIVDGSRQRRPAKAVVQTIADVDLVGGHYPWLILFSEKDTIWGEIESLASLYGVSAISGAGQPSYACTENTIKAIAQSQAYQDATPEALTVIALTDYDPFGFEIANAQFEQVQDLHPARLVRIGIDPDQLTPEQRLAKAYQPKDSGMERWFAQTGGVDGRPLGLELDALPITKLRAMFAAAIEERIDIERRREDLRTAFVDLIAWDVLMPDIEAKIDAMRQAVHDDEVYRVLTSTRIPGDLFSQAARAGKDYIDPLSMRFRGRALFDCEARIREVMERSLTDAKGD